MTAPGTDTQETQDKTAALPVVPPPVERKSEALSFGNFAKSVLMVAVVTKLSAIAGYAVGHLTPARILPEALQKLKQSNPPSKWLMGFKTQPFAIYTGYIGGAVGGLYEAWKRWRKDKGKELGVKDIHTDMYRELDPKILQAEVEQNQRIQEGIATLHGIAPRGSFTDAATREAAAAHLQATR